ncbi:MAG TPA: hypothetical protein VHO23_02550 [Candidatus Paceibacterota bacterium]|nr:hypothetical protein [Candidatus Paceibacterota bacterium]
MSLKAFNSAFGIQEDPSIEQGRFVARIHQSVFYLLEDIRYPSGMYEGIFRHVCYGLGVDPNPLIAEANRHNYAGMHKFIPNLKELIGNDFIKTLQVLILLREAVKGTEYVESVDRGIEIALASAVTDIGIRYTEGMFFPSGAKELDKILIEDNLVWLKEYETVRIQFAATLEHFKKSLTQESARKDAITNAYSTMEGLARAILGNSKNFDSNSNTVVEHLSLPNEYKNILHYYKEIANQYSSRHAGSSFSHAETEGFIYLTGVLMRLLLQRKN